MEPSLFWATPTPFDWVFIALVPILFVYLVGGFLWEEHQRRKREREAEKEFEDDLLRLYGADPNDHA
jgi:hypothetical protein